MNRFSTAFVSLTVALGLVACAAIPLKPGAERVRFAQAEPRGCEYLGDVSGIDGGLKMGGDMEIGARNDMRNKAVELGGNVVVPTSHEASYQTSVHGSSHGYGSGYGSGAYNGYGGRYGYNASYRESGYVSGGTYKSDVVMTGSVFRCPETPRRAH